MHASAPDDSFWPQGRSGRESDLAMTADEESAARVWWSTQSTMITSSSWVPNERGIGEHIQTAVVQLDRWGSWGLWSAQIRAFLAGYRAAVNKSPSSSSKESP